MERSKGKREHGTENERGRKCTSSGGLAYEEVMILTRGNGEYESAERVEREMGENGLLVVVNLDGRATM